MSQIAYSPSGSYIASGGEDGKVKIWNIINGQCFVTFNEHNAPITGLQFKSNGQVVCSSCSSSSSASYSSYKKSNITTVVEEEPVKFSLSDEHDPLIVEKRNHRN